MRCDLKIYYNAFTNFEYEKPFCILNVIVTIRSLNDSVLKVHEPCEHLTNYV